jgi:hypothetical protein
MSTIIPGRLNDVESAADFVTLTQDNFEVLSEEIYEFTPTYENGSPNTRNGPPTATTHATDELYRDQNGALWRCTAAGTPGTWLQILPALLAADPASGTFPTGYLLVNVTSGHLKIHAGGLVWKVVHLPVAGGTLDDGASVALGTGTGTRIGTTVSQKLGFWGATPVVQPSGADQAAVTLGNADGEIGGLTISDPPNQAEVQALRDKCEELADDVRALSTLVHALRAALVAVGVVKGGA